MNTSNNRVIIYKGERYYLNKDNRYVCPSDKGKQLSREIWKDNFGDIPEGYEIHHIDCDPSNNDIDNLLCLSAEEHHNLHKELLTDEQKQILREKFIQNVIPKASEWHKSEVGHIWHIQNAKHQHDIKAFTKKLTCSYCGEQYIGKIYKTGGNNFCSGKCKAAYRRNDDTKKHKRICQYCGKEYLSYKETKTCSKECRYKLLSITISDLSKEKL